MSDQQVGSPALAAADPTPAVAAEANADDANLADTLFGDNEDEDEDVNVRARNKTNGRAASAPADDDEEDEDEVVRRQVRRPRQRVDSNSASPPPVSASQAVDSQPIEEEDDRSPHSSRTGSPFGEEGSQDLDAEAAAARRQLEYKEEDDEAPGEDNIEVAHLSLPQLPVRRTKEHWLARIPHFLRYVTTPFEPEVWDDDQEEELLRQEGFTPGFSNDIGAASLLRTSNTIRWRYTNQLDKDGAKVPESNARIVRWSDGTMSLQVGSELFDITQQTERGRVSSTNTGTNTPQPSGAASQNAGPSSQLLSQATQSMPMGSSGSAYRPAQSLSYLVVPHKREAVMESEGPIAGSLAFTPADTRSETHRRIAKALRFQKTARVVATAAGEGALDPEIEKARIEKELKDAEKKRIRDREKADRKSGKFDDDMFDIESRRRSSRYVGGRKLGAGPRNADYYSDESEGAAGEEGAASGAKRGYAAQRYADDEDDGFIVDDEGDDDLADMDADGAPRSKKKRSSDDDDDADDDMQVDDEPDEMELAEQRIEEAERARKKAAAAASSSSSAMTPSTKPRRPEPAFSSDDEDKTDDDTTVAAAASQNPPSTANADTAATTNTKKKRIIESDEE